MGKPGDGRYRSTDELFTRLPLLPSVVIAVTHTAHRLEHRGFAPELLPQGPHHHVHHVAPAHVPVSPHFLDERCSTHRLALARQQARICRWRSCLAMRTFGPRARPPGPCLSLEAFHPRRAVGEDRTSSSRHPVVVLSKAPPASIAPTQTSGLKGSRARPAVHRWRSATRRRATDRPQDAVARS